MCQLPAIRLMAKETGQSLEEVGTTTARPPWVSVPMGILAGRPFEPAKRSSIHGRHRELGANVKWAGDWRRAYDYGDPQGEALAVHQAAGLIDVSTLGKLLVRGPDAGEFLDRLYPNRFSDLKPGRIRYGVISSDAGRIVDDGTICRIDEDTFYVTTTSSGAGAVEEWFSWWLADWRMRRAADRPHPGFSSAVNLAGPRAREILGELTELDCSPEAFKYLDGKQAKVAGVPCLILRIGFVGEVGYEIHFAAAYGEHVWDALMAAGADKGIRPFGLEPQRILRLQKMHILVGQDTDSESTPFGAAMPWIVKLDKEADFIGKWALEHYSEEEPATRLVGFTLANGHVPTEGSVILDGLGDPAGQVTSARFSPVLDRVIGMAWVPGKFAQDGARVTISDEGTTMQAEVQTRPFYDPDGRGAPLVSLAFLEPAGAERRPWRAARWRARPRLPAPGSRSATAGMSRSSIRARTGARDRRLDRRLAPAQARAPGRRRSRRARRGQARRRCVDMSADCRRGPCSSEATTPRRPMPSTSPRASPRSRSSAPRPGR